MNITILNGSPKKDLSVTMQYMKFLEKSFPSHRFNYIHAAFYGKRMEQNRGYFDEVMEQIRRADAVIWAFPLYYLLVHSRYKRFIELVFERQKQEVFAGKYTAALSTSIHFFDHTAHRYIRAVSEDLGMKYVDFYPAKMNDLTREENHPSLIHFLQKLLDHVERCLPVSRDFAPVIETGFRYRPGSPPRSPAPSPGGTVIVADIDPDRPNVVRLAERAAAAFEKAAFVNLRGIPTGPCRGCLQCGFDNRCSYGEEDPFVRTLQRQILPAERIIFVLGMHDRYFSHAWQRYLERNFVHTHQPVLSGKQVAFLISGPLRQVPNTREILQGYTETMQANLVDIITDEDGDSPKLDGLIDRMAAEMVHCSRHRILSPPTFLGVGGMKVFRDDIAAGLRFVFQEDHRYYRRHGIYDPPLRRVLQSVLFTLLTALSKLPPVKKKIQARMTSMMLRNYRKVLKNARSVEEDGHGVF